jgi:hypothetical protein
MAWLKRNLFFVITVAAGLIVTGYCGFLLYTAVAADKSISDDYASTLSNLERLQQAKPYPNKENLQAAKADQERVSQFLGDFRKSFSPFPTPPKEDARGFNEFLVHSIRQFGLEATNAGVLLPDSYDFGFQNQKEQLSYPPECIAPWMTELEEIKAILHILYASKINYLEGIQRPPVSPDDNYGPDILQAGSVSNQVGVTTPYRVMFRSFSTEIASVLAGFAGASNCFIVKTIDVTISRAPLPQVIVPPPAPAAPAAPVYVPPVFQPNPYQDEGPRRGRRGPGDIEYPRRQYQQPTQEAAPVPTGPVTILSENPLFVTLVVDVVKLKSAGH